MPSKATRVQNQVKTTDMSRQVSKNNKFNKTKVTTKGYKKNGAKSSAQEMERRECQEKKVSRKRDAKR